MAEFLHAFNPELPRGRRKPIVANARVAVPVAGGANCGHGACGRSGAERLVQRRGNVATPQSSRGARCTQSAGEQDVLSLRQFG